MYSLNSFDQFFIFRNVLLKICYLLKHLSNNNFFIFIRSATQDVQSACSKMTHCTMADKYKICLIGSGNWLVLICLFISN